MRLNVVVKKIDDWLINPCSNKAFEAVCILPILRHMGFDYNIDYVYAQGSTKEEAINSVREQIIQRLESNGGEIIEITI